MVRSQQYSGTSHLAIQAKHLSRDGLYGCPRCASALALARAHIRTFIRRARASTFRVGFFSRQSFLSAHLQKKKRATAAHISTIKELYRFFFLTDSLLLPAPQEFPDPIVRFGVFVRSRVRCFTSNMAFDTERLPLIMLCACVCAAREQTLAKYLLPPLIVSRHQCISSGI